MDNRKFGQFIQNLRKEKGWTQLELAEKLNVTDKAVSKWERGVGFPDIKMIEPLARALDVSILEIMCSEKNEKTVQSEKTEEAINNVLNVVSYQRKIERRNILLTVIIMSVAIMTVFIFDTSQGIGFVMVCMPCIFLICGIYLIVLSVYRAKRKMTYLKIVAVGLFALLIPILTILLLYLGVLSGGPVPT